MAKKKSRAELHAEFISSLVPKLQMVGTQKTGAKNTDRELNQMLSDDYAIGDLVQRSDDKRIGKIIEIYGKLVRILPVNGNRNKIFLALTYFIRKVK